MNIIFDNPYLTTLWKTIRATGTRYEFGFRVEFVSLSFIKAISSEADQIYTTDLELCVSFFPMGAYVHTEDLKGDWLRNRTGFNVKAYDWMMDTIDSFEKFMNKPQTLGQTLMLEHIAREETLYIGDHNSLDVTRIIQKYSVLKESDIVNEAKDYFNAQSNLWHIKDGHVYVSFDYAERFIWYSDKFFRSLYEKVVNIYLNKHGFFGVKALQFELPEPIKFVTNELEGKCEMELKEDGCLVDLP